MKFWFISCNFIEIKEIFGTFSIGTSYHTTNVTKSTCCSVISNGQYKCFILLLTHFSQQSLRFISIRSYLLISPLTHDWNYSISLSLSLSLSLSFSTHVCIAFNFICNMHSVCLNIFFLVFILFSFCSLVIVGYAPIFDEVFYPLLSIIPNSQMESIFRLA